MASMHSKLSIIRLTPVFKSREHNASECSRAPLTRSRRTPFLQRSNLVPLRRGLKRAWHVRSNRSDGTEDRENLLKDSGLEHGYRFGVEAEVFLEPKIQVAGRPESAAVKSRGQSNVIHYESDTHFQFAEVLTNRHNKDVSGHKLVDHLLRSALCSVPNKSYDNWFIEFDQTLNIPELPKIGLELISPVLDVHSWRNTVKATWDFLGSNYHITGDETCSTHVHVSRAPDRNYSLEELKAIAQAVIWWEPAWEAILPYERRGNIYARSLYLDHFYFAWSGRTRSESIDLIESCSNMDQLLGLLHPSGDANFGWEFLHVADPLRTIEFRRGTYSRSREDIEMWISVATSFIFAAMKAGSTRAYTSQKCSVRGLKEFILSGRETMRIQDIERLFQGKADRETERPIPFDSKAENGKKLDELAIPRLGKMSEKYKRLMRLTEPDVGN